MEFYSIPDLDELEMLGEGEIRSCATIGLLTNLVRLSVDLEFMVFWKGSQLPREFAEAFFYPLLADAPRQEMAFNAMDAFAGRHPEIEAAWQGIKERLTDSQVKRIYDAAVLARPSGGRDRRYAGLFPFTGHSPQQAELEAGGTEHVRLDFASVRKACEDLLALRDDLTAFVEHLPSRHVSSSVKVPALRSDEAHPAAA